MLFRSNFLAHLRFNRVTDEKGRYLPFDELQYRIKKGENVDVAWTLTRLARNAAIQRINYCNEAGEQAGFNITPVIAEACEAIRWWIKDGGRDCRIRSNNCYGQVIRRDQESALACWGIDQ